MTQALLTATTRTVDIPTTTPSITDTVGCPECGTPATVEWRTTIDSTSGPVENLKISCPEGHRFLMPSDRH